MVWIDIERGTEAKHYLHNMVELNMMEGFVPIGWPSVSAPITLPCSVKWIVMRIKSSEMRRGHESMRKHDI
jgi:hypothetical protein